MSDENPSDELNGAIVFFDNHKGYGSVRADGSAEKYFFDYNDLQMPGRLRTVSKGQIVTFRTQKQRNKTRAVEVRPKQ